MKSLSSLFRLLAILVLMSSMGAAWIWHRMIVDRVAAEAESRGQRIAIESFRRQRKTEIMRLKREAAQDRARNQRIRNIRKELLDVSTIDDDCRVPADVLRLLDTIGTESPIAP